MKEVTKVCIHCGSAYRYILSGAHFYDHRVNDARFCPECMTEMVKILDSIPVKFKDVWVDASDEITLEELYASEKKVKESKSGFPMVRRVFPGLYGSGDSSHTREINVNGVSYYLTEWEHFHEYQIERNVRWNLIKDVAVNPKDNKSRERKILYNPNKSSEPGKPFKVESIQALTPPSSLAYALRFGEDRQYLLNQEIDIAMNNEVRDV